MPLDRNVLNSITTLDRAVERVTTEVYDASVGIFENLEHRRLIHGNGHHIAQKIAEYAANIMRERWEQPKS